MILNSWLTRKLITRAARAYGFLDPIGLLAKLRGFAQPSEVAEPIELLRAGMLFHARGLVNTKAIQNNLDWVWPFWVERQFNPADESFIPRAFSFSHINLTHRNWTAVGLPDIPYYPVVDPRGLVTPLFDSWSLDFWFVKPNGTVHLPSKLNDLQQTLSFEDNLRIRTAATWGDCGVRSEVSMGLENHEPYCCISVSPTGESEGFIAVALRPYNPEGVSFVEKIAVAKSDSPGWLVNGQHPVIFDREPKRHSFSIYKEGDVLHRLSEEASSTPGTCSVGLASAAALFPANSLRIKPLEVRIPIYNELALKKRPSFSTSTSWKEATASLARLSVNDKKFQTLYELAATNLVLHTPLDAYPGPYTYKRFWFRDAALILYALVTIGGVDRTRRALGEFAPRQRHDGYFLSQEGEWDSNGEAIWIYHRFASLTGEALPAAWMKAIAKGANWIVKKRLPEREGFLESGLLPAGFSAEHLGPNDFYYWDNFWGVAGLRCAAQLFKTQSPTDSTRWAGEADRFFSVIERSFPAGPQRRFPGAIPASPKRRMDSGAVGSLVADYPLRLTPPGDSRMAKTADYLRDYSMYRGGFFQNMIHSGINAYLTLHMAQVRLRAGDTASAWELIDAVAALASPTGQWPEAIHPRTGGGCMGDGQHIWAASEWVMMMRNCFVREEADGLILASGVKPEWWSNSQASFGPTLTPYGAITVKIAPEKKQALLSFDATWRSAPPRRIEIRLPGFVSQIVENPGAQGSVVLTSRSV